VFGSVAGGEIYCTNDGGQTWQSHPSPMDCPEKENEFMLTSCILFDSLRGWAVSEDAIYETDDGAHIWAKHVFFDSHGRPVEHSIKTEYSLVNW
jgi:photosystem II stability/assembly factor-like uncharacterized protein